MWVSMVLTSQAHRRCASGRNRRIPTILAGCFGGRLVDVSAVDTGPRGSESGVLGGTARRRRGVERACSMVCVSPSVGRTDTDDCY